MEAEGPSDKIRRGLARLKQIWSLDQSERREPPPTREELANYSFYGTPHGKTIPRRRGGRRQKFQS